MIHGGASSTGAIASAVYVQQLLFALRGANLAITTDQLFTKLFTGTNWMPLNIVAVRKTGAFSVAALGALNTGAGGTGNAIVAATQSFAGLTGAAKIVSPVLAAIALSDVQSSATLYLKMATGNSAALTADLFVFGTILD